MQIPATSAPDRKPDPKAKPTWEQWCEWDVFRKILNDDRIPDAGFRLWHWYHNCKGRASGPVRGFRAQAWYIARKFGWKRERVYQLNELLQRCDYLRWTVEAGNSYSFYALEGTKILPTNAQPEFPFIVP